MVDSSVKLKTVIYRVVYVTDLLEKCIRYTLDTLQRVIISALCDHASLCLHVSFKPLLIVLRAPIANSALMARLRLSLFFSGTCF